MGDTLFLILRRLRRPFLIVIAVLAISIAGLANIPGIDAQGNPATLGYFYAFYVVSYTATTIGFGEVPYPFTNAQRLWVICSIYISVIAWAYALGSAFQMTRDPAFRDVVARNRLMGQLRRLVDPFILIVGYGQSGAMLARMLDSLGYRIVIIENNLERTMHVENQEYRHTPLVLTADGRWPQNLVDAGLTHRLCQAMVVLSGDDDTVQAAAISGTTLNPSLRIIARVCAEVAIDNLDTFTHIEVVNPFETFAANLGRNLQSPEKLCLEDWLTGLPGTSRANVINLPPGHWVICGYGRFGHYIAQALTQAGSSWTAIDDSADADEEISLIRKEYSVASLKEAGIENAVGLVACTNRDAINLACIMRARAINPELFFVTRQVHASNAGLVEASQADMRFVQAEIMSHEVRQLITTPLLNRFLINLRLNTSDLAERSIAELEQQVGNKVPFLWAFNCWAAYPGLKEAFAFDTKNPLTLGDLLLHPNTPTVRLNVVALLLLRNTQAIELPAANTVLKSGDKILFAGSQGVENIQKRHLYAPSPLPFMRTGVEPPRSWVFRKWEKIKQEKRWRKG